MPDDQLDEQRLLDEIEDRCQTASGRQVLAHQLFDILKQQQATVAAEQGYKAARRVCEAATQQYEAAAAQYEAMRTRVRKRVEQFSRLLRQQEAPLAHLERIYLSRDAQMSHLIDDLQDALGDVQASGVGEILTEMYAVLAGEHGMTPAQVEWLAAYEQERCRGQAQAWAQARAVFQAHLWQEACQQQTSSN